MKSRYFVWLFAAVGYVSIITAAFIKSFTDGLIALGFLSMVYSAMIYTNNQKNTLF